MTRGVVGAGLAGWAGGFLRETRRGGRTVQAVVPRLRACLFNEIGGQVADRRTGLLDPDSADSNERNLDMFCAPLAAPAPRHVANEGFGRPRESRPAAVIAARRHPLNPYEHGCGSLSAVSGVANLVLGGDDVVAEGLGLGVVGCSHEVGR